MGEPERLDEPAGYPLSPARSRSPASSPGRQSPAARSPKGSDVESVDRGSRDDDLDMLNTMDVFQQAADRKSVSSRRSVLSQVVRMPRAFHPNSEFRVMLDLTYFFAGLYTLFAALYLVCFGIEAPPGPFLVASGLADAAFVADLVFNLNTGFVRVEKGLTEVVLDVWPAMLHYMFNGMLMDAVISVPILTIQYAYFYFFGSDPSWTVAMTLRVLHTCKMLCALRMSKIFEKFRKNNPGKNFAVSVASSITFIIALTHLFACLWMVSAGLSYTPPSDAFLRIFATDDVDECMTGAHNCDFPWATCTNTAGSFTCTCHGGMVGNGTECYECPEYSSTFTRMTCRLYGEALAEPLVYTPPTMEQISSGQFVNDVDECLNGTHNCDPHATCVNTPGSFSCDCQLGFEGSGVTCHSCNEPDTVLQHMDLYQQYACAMYFSINIGFRIGDGYVEPKSSSERLLFIFAACALVGLISYMASRYSLGASTKCNPHQQFLVHRHQMSQFFVERGMSKTQNRTEAETIQKSAPRVEQATWGLMQPATQVAVFRNLYEHAFSSVMFFGDKRRDNVFWQFIMQHSEVVVHGDGDVISAKGDLEDYLHVIKSGQVKEVKEDGKALRAMKRPCHWGEGALLKAVANSLRYTQARIVAKGIVEVFIISTHALETLVNRDAEVHKLCMDFIHDEMQTYMSLKYNAMSKRLCAWAVEKAQIEFRAYNMGRDDLRPRAFGRLR